MFCFHSLLYPFHPFPIFSLISCSLSFPLHFQYFSHFLFLSFFHFFCISGLGDRLYADLVDKFDSNTPLDSQGGHHRHMQHSDFKVYPSTLHREPGYTFQRKFAPWIGGSIIGSLATHSELKISRQEWEEGAESSSWQTKCF